MNLRDFLNSYKFEEKIIFEKGTFFTESLKDLAIKGDFSLAVDVVNLRGFVNDRAISMEISPLEDSEGITLIFKIIKSSSLNGFLKYYGKNNLSLKLARGIFNLIINIKLANGNVEYISGSDRIDDFVYIFKRYEELKDSPDYADVLDLLMEKDFSGVFACGDFLISQKEEDFLRHINCVKLDLPPSDSLNISNVKLISYKDLNSEVLQTLLNISNSTSKIDDVEIIYSVKDYLPLIKNYCSLLNIPIYGVMDSCENSKVYTLVELLSQWNKSGYRFSQFKKIMDLGIFNVDFENLYNYSDILGGENIYRVLFTESRQVEFLNLLFSSSPIYRESFNFVLGSFVNLLNIFFSKNSLRTEDSYAITALNTAQGIYNLDEVMDTGEIYDTILEILRSTIIKSDQEGIKLHSISDSFKISGSKVYVLGLNAEYFPREERENPLLNDFELNLFSPSVINAKKRGDEAIKNGYRSLNSSNTEFIISKCDFNSKGIELTPSGIFSELGESVAYENKMVHLLDEKSMDSNFSLAEDEVRDIFNNHVFSPTSLEELIRCPKCFFYKYILKFAPYSEETLEDNTWLPAYEGGNLVHETLRRYVDNVMEKGHGTYFDEFEILMNIFDDVCGEFLSKYPPGKLGDFHYYKNIYEGMILHGFDNMSHQFDENRRYLGTELSFGNSKSTLSKDPVTIQVGKYNLKIRGTIDRVDYDGEKVFIVDYKTGSPLSFINRFSKGEIIQTEVYKMVFKNFLGKFGLDDSTEIFPVFEFLRDGSYEVLEGGNGISRLERTIDLVMKRGFISVNEMKNLGDEFLDLELTSEEIESRHKYSEYREVCR